MANQFDPMPPQGAAPYAPRPSSPRGLYRQFGAPESLLRIHFPNRDPNQNPSTSNPWYWWITQVRPSYFSFLFTRWVRLPAFPIIKILQIDSQQLVPTPPVGFTNIQSAIAGWNPDIFGRFDERDQKFWDLITNEDNGKNDKMPRAKPPFDVIKGQIRARQQGVNINNVIRAAVTRFRDNFNALANGYNAIAAGVGPDGFHYPGQNSPFNFPLPDGPPTTISHFQLQLNSFVQGPPYLQSAAYIGPISGTAFFNINTFTTQAQAFAISIGQLDPKKWNMSVFPPLDSTRIGNGASSFISGDYGGYSSTPFPLHGLEIM